MAQAEGRMAIKDAHCNDDVLSTMEPTVEPIRGSGQAAQRWPFLLWGGGLPWTALVSPMTPDDALLVAFSELAPDYERTMNRELQQYLGVGYQAFVEGLLDRAAVGPDDWVLDVATGTALIPRRLAVSRDGHGSGRAVGVDITPAMLNGGNRAIRAGNLSATAFLVGGSGMELPFAPQVFDVAVCAFGTHHMDAPRLLRETRRVLRPGGRLVVAEAGAPSYWRTVAGRLVLKVMLSAFGLTQSRSRNQIEEDAFRQMHTATEWRAMLSNAGFGAIQVRELRARRAWYPRALTMYAEVA